VDNTFAQSPVCDLAPTAKQCVGPGRTLCSRSGVGPGKLIGRWNGGLWLRQLIECQVG
jgi:hypothetical protein